MPSEDTEQRILAAIIPQGGTDMVGNSALSQPNEALALELPAENQRLLGRQFRFFNGGVGFTQPAASREASIVRPTD